METKLFEIRDVGTFIPALAIRFVTDHGAGDYLLRRAGYGPGRPYVLLFHLATCEGGYDPFAHNMGRTMSKAHMHIEKHWSDLASGNVIDVEFLLGETSSPKQSERFAGELLP